MMTEQSHSNLWFKTSLDADSFPFWGGVLNPLARVSIIQEFFTLALSLPYYPLFQGTAYEGMPRHSPLLFSLPDPNHLFLRHLTSLPPTWGFLWCGNASFELAKYHWQSLLTVLLPSGVFSHLRLYSPTVLKKLAEACPAVELAWLLGPCARIFLPHHPQPQEFTWLAASNPALVHRSATEIAQAYQPQSKPWWQVTAAHLDAFADTLHNVYLENTVQHIWDVYPDLAGEVEIQYGSVRQFAADALEAAHHYGFENPEHEYRFLLLCLHYDVNTDTSKDALRVLAHARRQPEETLRQLEKTLRNPVYERKFSTH